MPKNKINSSYLCMPLDGDKYEKIDGNVASEKIEELVKNTAEGLISTFKNEEGNFPFQAVKKK